MSDLSERQHLDRLLSAVLDCESDAERTACLDRLCGDDPSLRASLERMLAACLGEGGLLRDGDLQSDGALDGLTNALDDGAAPSTGDTGERVGPYRLLEELGRGGMGVVWHAERADGAFDQQVALKLVHGGLGAGALAERLVRERQVLARLQHPGIAQLLDGGIDERGQPWFAMELVDGEEITRYCHEHQLGLRERVALVEEIALTVDYAHRHLLVHRDIKPANVLVDAAGRPRLLDFGIARLLDASNQEGMLTLTQHQQPFTPRYASPEQLLGDTPATASDVYQLGLLLFELITGEPAFDATETTPSAMVNAAHSRAPAQPSRLTTVPKDVDAIVMTATRPEPPRRYLSARAFAQDLRAWLDGHAVAARGDALTYRARRFASRHRLGVATASLAVLATIGLTAALAWGIVNADRERRRAEATGAFLADTLRGAQPYVAQGRDTALLEALLEDAAERIETELADQPYAAADVHITIAETLRVLSDYERARSHAAAAADTFVAQLGANAKETLRAQDVLALILWDLGRYEDAELLARDVLTRAENTLPDDDPVRAQAVNTLGLAIRAQGRLQDAEPYYRQALDAARRASGPYSHQALVALGNLAFLLAELDRLGEAEPYAAEAAKLAREHLGENDPDTWLAVDKLGSLLSQQGRGEEALPLHLEASENLERILGPRHSTTLGSQYATATALRRLDQHEQAIAMLERMVPIIRAEYGPRSRFMFPTLNQLGQALLASGQAGQAQVHLEEALAIARELLGQDHHHCAVISIQLADAVIDTDGTSAPRASALLAAARSILEQRFGSDGSHRFFEDLVRVEARLAAGGVASQM
ncbi:MAG: serine/threonine-protein kinase [Pseudomonadota bacterium]